MENKTEARKRTNAIIVAIWDGLYEKDFQNLPEKGKRLNRCRAYMYETENYVWLQSYKTFVAVYDKKRNEVLDIMRETYGYTATTCQHIHKFMDLMGATNGKRPYLMACKKV